MNHLPSQLEKQRQRENNAGVVGLALVAVTLLAFIGTTWWVGRVLRDIYQVLHG